MLALAKTTSESVSIRYLDESDHVKLQSCLMYIVCTHPKYYADTVPLYGVSIWEKPNGLIDNIIFVRDITIY